jgi:hypothetical protein
MQLSPFNNLEVVVFFPLVYPIEFSFLEEELNQSRVFGKSRVKVRSQPGVMIPAKVVAFCNNRKLKLLSRSNT